MTNITPTFEEEAAPSESSNRMTLMTSSVMACALTLILVSGLASAQTPKGSQPPAASVAPLAAQTSDGRAFSLLSEKDVDALSDADFDAYHK
jgi:hypothetical protein